MNLLDEVKPANRTHNAFHAVACQEAGGAERAGTGAGRTTAPRGAGGSPSYLREENAFTRARDLIGPLTDKPKPIRCPVPEHEDRHPSAMLYPDGFHCFSCGAHGDSVTYISLTENVSVGEVLRRVGVEGRKIRGPRRPEPPPKWANDLAMALLTSEPLAQELAIAETLSVDPDGFYLYLNAHPAAFCRALVKRGLSPLAVYDLIELIFAVAGDPYQTREVS